MTPQDLLRRVTASLAHEQRNTEPASTVLAEVIDWSWSMLSPSQQTLFARLSVFVGGWTLQAAEAVVSPEGLIAEDLANLVERGLVLQTENFGSRYEMLESVQSFAAERLADRLETDMFRDRMVSWLRNLNAELGIPELHSWADASVALLPERANVAAALSHLRDANRGEELVWFTARACGMWINHGFSEEIGRWLGPYVDDVSVSIEARSAAAAMVMEAAHAEGDLGALTKLGLKALELANGAPYEWIPAVAGFLGMWSLIYPVPIPTDALFDIASQATHGAATAKSRSTNEALLDMYRGHAEFAMRRFDSAALLFNRAHDAKHPGRLLLLAESGEALSLYLAGRRDEATRAVDGWVSRAHTDEWHYIVDVVRAVVQGGAGGPTSAADATQALASAVRYFKPASVWGRADDFQTAFGLTR